MKIEKLQINDCLKFADEIGKLLLETLSINLPKQRYSIKQAEQMVNDLAQYLLDGTAVVFAAFNEEDLIGFLWAYSRVVGSEKRMHLNHLAVKESSRGKGIGSMLMCELEEYTRANNYAGIDLLSSISNQRAISFYEKRGYLVERVQLYKEVQS